MPTSTFDIFKIGIGPSSSHTVGPMNAIREFLESLKQTNILTKTHRLKIELFGSLALTGKGHGTDKAILLGMEGEKAATVDIQAIDSRLKSIRSNNTVNLLQQHTITFNESQDLIFNQNETLQYFSNGMIFIALDKNSEVLKQETYYSIGGGFIKTEREVVAGKESIQRKETPYPFSSALDLLQLCKNYDFSISQLMYEREKVWYTEAQIADNISQIYQTMEDSIHRGITTTGVLPGGLEVKRRAPGLFKSLSEKENLTKPNDELKVIDWVSLYAIAVNEENAAGGRVVTAPTNGASGLIPAVMYYAKNFIGGFDHTKIQNFLLTAAAIAILYKKNASIAASDVGCQGEVGVSSSMAAGALAELLGGTPQQVENAAEIAMEHNLGLTCDPIKGLVQIPCIERNAIGANKAITAARLALRSDGTHFVSLDKVISTMRQTGKDMQSMYKETAKGGLAVNVIEC